jgi:hypothetical protein
MTSQINNKWIFKVIQYMNDIEGLDYQWTLKGFNNAKLSACGLFAKLVYIFQNYNLLNKNIEEINKFKVLNIINHILLHKHNTGFYIDNTTQQNDIIAESRQALSGINNLSQIDIKLKNILEEQKEKINLKVNLDIFYKDDNDLYFMKDYLWDNPWSAGAQLSHYLYYLNHNIELSNNEEQKKSYQQKIDKVLQQLKKYQKIDGWYNRKPQDHVRINGIMKVFTGLDAINYDYSNITEIIKTIIDDMLLKNPEAGGCNIYDYVYVLSKSKDINYRLDECKEKLLKVYDLILSYQHEDGGFSYNRNSTTQVMYSKKITDGGCRGGIHGTTLMCMALTLIDNFCELGLNLKLPKS